MALTRLLSPSTFGQLLSNAALNLSYSPLLGALLGLQFRLSKDPIFSCSTAAGNSLPPPFVLYTTPDATASTVCLYCNPLPEEPLRIL